VARLSFIPLIVLLLAGAVAGQEKKFTQRYDLHVPPKGGTGVRPDRSLDPPAEFVLPEGYTVDRVAGPVLG